MFSPVTFTKGESDVLIYPTLEGHNSQWHEFLNYHSLYARQSGPGGDIFKVDICIVWISYCL